MMYADFSFYKQNFFGSLVSENDFERVAVKASAFLDYYTQGRAKRNADSEALKLACCAVAEQCYIEEIALEASVKDVLSGGAKTSETVGSYSVSYAASSDSSSTLANARAEKARVAQQYLAGTNLLYRGGCRYVCSAHSDGL